MLDCPECGHVPSPRARFCELCGHRLDLARAQGGSARTIEARQVTVLFCDLVRSTQLANQLDLEDLRAVFRSFWEVVSRVAQRHKGHVIRFVGDGALVSFGYPVALEDAAELAVRAGRDLAVEIQAIDVAPAPKVDVRVGIASGTVAMGELIEQAIVPEDSLIGTVPHLAVRLMSEAPPGGVVVSDAIHREAGRFFAYKDLGKLELKGFPVPERAWLVLGDTAIASRFQASADADGPSRMVGRRLVLAQLDQQWAAAREGEGRTVALCGEPGIGKSRLVEAMRQVALQDGAAVVTFDCMQRNSLTPLHPVLVWLRNWTGIGPFDDQETHRTRAQEALAGIFAPEAIAGTLEGLAPLLALSVGPMQLSADLERERSITLLVQLVLGLAAGQPVLVICEDMHWADASTLLLVQRIVKPAGSARLLVLATMRPMPEAAEALLPGATEIGLEALPSDEALELVRLACHEHPLDEAAVAAIVRRGEGVPLYLEELTRNAAEWSERPHAEGATASGSLHIPGKVQALIQARLDRLPDLKPLAQAAAVVGREFQLSLLSALVGDRHGDLLAAVARLQQVGLLAVPAAHDAALHRFRHALIHDAAYQTLLRNDRKRLHGQLADLLLHQFAGQPEATKDVIGHHLASAARFDEAVHCFLSASMEAAARAAYVESIGHTRAGLDLVDQVPDIGKRATSKLQLATQLALGLAATEGYAAPTVEQAYRAARNLCSNDAEPAAHFAVVRGMATFYIVRCQLRTADEVAEQCMALAGRTARPEMLIEALTARGYCKVYLGRLDEGRAALDQCADMYQSRGGRGFAYPSPQDPAIAAWSLLATVAWLQGDAAGSEQSMTAALAHAELLARPFDRAYAHCYAAKLRNLQGRPDEAVDHADRCVAISTQHGLNTWLAAGTMQAAVGMATGSRPAEGAATLKHVLGLFVAAGAELNAPYFLWGLARGQLAGGDAAAARETLVEGLRRCDATGEVYLKAHLQLLAAEIAPSADDALRLRREARALAERQGSRQLVQQAERAIKAASSSGI